MTIKKLTKEGYTVVKSTVSKVWKSVGSDSSKNCPAKIQKKKTGPPLIRTPTKIKKVAELCSKDNSIPQRRMAKKIGVSQHTIHRIIHEDLGATIRKKPKVHFLSQKAIKQRKDGALNFHNIISENLEYIFTMDDATAGLQERKDRFRLHGRVIPTAVKSSSFPAQRMFAAGYSYRGSTRLYAVPQKAKVNADLFIKKILKPMFDIDVPKLYRADA
ncbi:hypothetical protein RvY_00518 [Ramazzottius varieornatus]|uniref:Transposase Tc1-like domain-containing protein n=1 Tax=Ramazzottius varieornatus TaxID=947166 RepID=A0A1D1UKB7_RAMVA|nr:hypothetical protein RvY_00518 [Ramazzottius varieornatus]